MHCVFSTSLAVLSAAVAIASAQHSGWDAKNFKNIVTFGDSYTDESRLGYFINNNGSAPPIGWQQPVVRSICLRVFRILYSFHGRDIITA